MQHWNAKRRRQRQFIQLLALMLVTGVIVVSMQPEPIDGAENLPELVLKDRQIMPVREVSGLALRQAADGVTELFAVGDKDPELAHLTVKDNQLHLDKVSNFAKVLLDELSLCNNALTHHCQSENTNLTSQWEAVAVDGSQNFFLLKEEPSVVMMFNEDFSELKSLIKLDFSYFESLKSKTSKTVGAKVQVGLNDLGEGFLLLKNGHILVAKEKNPPALVEFGPAGAAALGAMPESILPKSQTFTSLGKRVDYVPLKVWFLSGNCDASELAANDKGNIFLLSQTCGTLAEYESLSLAKEKVNPVTRWKLPKKIRRAEAFAVLPNGDFVIGSDSKKEKRNSLYWVTPEQGQAQTP